MNILFMKPLTLCDPKYCPIFAYFKKKNYVKRLLGQINIFFKTQILSNLNVSDVRILGSKIGHKQKPKKRDLLVPWRVKNVMQPKDPDFRQPSRPLTFQISYNSICYGTKNKKSSPILPALTVLHHLLKL